MINRCSVFFLNFATQRLQIMLLKRLSLYLLTLILVVATSGINVNVQYCYGQFIGVQINGLHFLTEIGEDMTCCQDNESGCEGCNHIHYQHQIHSQYLVSQSVDISPTLSSLDWLHGDFPYCINDYFTFAVEEGSDSRAGFYDPPPCYDNAIILQKGLRAPPVWA